MKDYAKQDWLKKEPRWPNWVWWVAYIAMAAWVIWGLLEALTS